MFYFATFATISKVDQSEGKELSDYVPDALDQSEWQECDPASVGVDATHLQDAIDFARQSESAWPVDLARVDSLPGLTQNEPEPWNEILGPLLSRGGSSGVLLVRGKKLASWGEPARVEMTFSVAKSYLAILAGLAVGDGLISDIDEPVHETVRLDEFSSRRNRKITWRHLLTQTSEWTGTLFEKPDQVDHFRQVGAGADNGRKGEKRKLSKPGTFWEYNDVRVNVLSLALLHVFKRPLPTVLRDRIMDPIGASDTWAWHGYRNSTVDVDGVALTSVPGGTHWGGGLWINSLDHARLGLLIQRKGLWGHERLLPEAWVDEMLTPIDLYRAYGMLWWLNTAQAHFSEAPPSSVFALGAGSHVIWIDAALDVVGVFRWVDKAKTNEIIGKFSRAFNDGNH